MSRSKAPPPGVPAEAIAPPQPTYPCKLCGRKFIKASLAKHETACKLLQKSKRKVFDAGKQRATNSDVSIQGVRKAQKEYERVNGHFERPKTRWKERHEEFVDTIRSAKGVDHALRTGQPLPPPPKSVVPSDYVQCEYCGRNFNSSAAERHIPFCKDRNRLAPSAAAKPAAGRSQPPRLKTQAGSGGATKPPQSRRGQPSPNRSTATATANRQPTRAGGGGGGGSQRTGAPPTRHNDGVTSAGHRESKTRSGATTAAGGGRRSNSAPRTRAGAPPTAAASRTQNNNNNSSKAPPTRASQSPVRRATKDMRGLNVRSK